jgi:hypothetical protein
MRLILLVAALSLSACGGGDKIKEFEAYKDKMRVQGRRLREQGLEEWRLSGGARRT